MNQNYTYFLSDQPKIRLLVCCGISVICVCHDLEQAQRPGRLPGEPSSSTPHTRGADYSHSRGAETEAHIDSHILTSGQTGSSNSRPPQSVNKHPSRPLCALTLTRGPRSQGGGRAYFIFSKQEAAQTI